VILQVWPLGHVSGARVNSALRSTRLRTLIVNGEPAMRAHLQRLCAIRPELDVIGEAASGSQAIDVFQKRGADLVLLDSRLPDMSGYDCLKSLTRDGTPSTVMVTTGAEEPMDEAAGVRLSYLPRPIGLPRFNAAIDQALAESFDGPIAIAEFAPIWERGLPPQIIGEKARKFYFLDAHTVEYLASAGNYVATHAGGEEFLTRATMKRMSALLEPLGFVRIERSLLVNPRQVAYVERRDRGQYGFMLRSGQRLVSSRERSAAVRALLLSATAGFPTR
jgi:two-component system LytT family response regulator